MKDLDSDYLERLEGVIEKGKRTFVDVGLALEQIRQEKLYRKAGHKTFEEYCQKRWGWNSQRGRQLINSALVVEAVTKQIGTTVPISERAARELSKVPTQDRAEVLTSVSKNGPVTAKAIISQADARLYTSAKNVDSVKAKEKLPEERKDAIGRLIPDAILAEWDRATQVGGHLRSLASEIKTIVKRGLDEKDLIFGEVLNPTIAEISQVYYSLSQIIPHSVCPTCQGRNKMTCPLCRKRGWISKFMWNSPSVSEATKRIIEKAASKGTQ